MMTVKEKNDSANASAMFTTSDEMFLEQLESYLEMTALHHEQVAGKPCILFRHPRQRNYFAVQQAQVLHVEPIKYTLRVTGLLECDTMQQDALLFELLVKKQDQYEFVPHGIQVKKQITVRNAPKDTLDVMVVFCVDSRMYGGNPFVVRVRLTETSAILCQSLYFYLERKEKK